MEFDAYLIKSFQFPFGVFDQLRGNESELKGQINIIHQKAPNNWGPLVLHVKLFWRAKKVIKKPSRRDSRK